MKGLPSNLFPHLKEQDIVFLENAVSDEEIKKALFDINPLKASRSNGFHTHFFQSQWDIVGNAVCEWVQGVFDGNNIDPELNNTLTPEKDSLEKFS